ncbi:MAG: CHAT domain-containing tetratricopeptide repeat protein [Bryobacteraceae bacterium]
MAELAGVGTDAARKARRGRTLPAALSGLILLGWPAFAQDARWRQVTAAAMQLYDAGKYDQALPAAQESVRLAGPAFGPESRQVAISLNDLGLVLEALDRWAEAEPLYRRSLALNEKALGPQHPEVAANLNNLGILYLHMGRLAEAADSLARALSIREKAPGPNNAETATNMANLALVFTAQAKYADAEALDRRALTIDEKALGPEDAGVAKDLNNLAEACFRQSKYAQAEPLYVRALSIHLKLFGNESIFVATDLNNIGALYTEQGKYALAEATYRRSLAIDEKAAAGKGLTIASDLNNLAGLFVKLAQFPEAEPLYRRALAIDEKALGPEHPTVARVLSNLAALDSAQGRYEEAEAAYRRALAIREKALGTGHPLVAITLSGLAMLKKEQGQYPEALALYQRALGIDEKALGAEHPQVATILNDLGALYLELVQVPLAAPLFRRALAIHEKSLGPDHPDVAADLMHLAEVYAAGGQAEEAAPLYERVIAIDGKAFGAASLHLANPLLGLASLRQRQAKYAEAELLEKRALSILEASAGPDHTDTRGALLDLAITYYGWGRTELAATYFDRGLASLARQVDSSFTYMSERQRLQFLATEPGAFPLLFSFALNNQERDAALAGKMYDGLLWEKGLIAANAAALRAKILDGGDREAVGLFDRLAAKRTQLAALASAPAGDLAEWRKAMAQLDQEANGIETDLVKRSAALAEAKALARITWRDVQKGLKPDEAAVEYVRFPVHNGAGWMHADAYAAVVLTPTAAPRALLLGNAQKLEAEPVAAYRADVGRSRGVSIPAGKTGAEPDAGSGTGAAYAAFWKPLEAALGGATRVYVAADGILNQVPIGLFSDPAGKLLLEKYDLRVVNSTKDLLRPQRGGGGRTAVVMGNPAFDLTEAAQREAVSKLNAGAAIQTATTPAEARPASRGSERSAPLPPLPATQAEALAVALSLKNAGWQVSLYTGSMALKEVMERARSPRVVHLATHGFFLATPATADKSAPGARPSGQSTGQPALRDPMLRSGLFFAGADRTRAGERPAAGLEDGVLTAYEASQLHLQGTELVVLSACETGLGQQANGEGVFGLRRGLQEAGAESVLMSMWPVPDQETQELMTLFYQQWLGGLDAHEALRRAQLKERDTVRQRYGRDLPYYWGAFVLVGR